MRVSEALRRAIKKSGHTRYVISKEAGVFWGSVDRFLQGERGLRLESVDRLCEFLGLELTPIKQKKGKGAK